MILRDDTERLGVLSFSLSLSLSLSLFSLEDHLLARHPKMFSRIVCFLAFLAVSFAAIVDPLTAYGYEASAELERVKVTSDGGITKIVLKQGNGKKATAGANIVR